MMDLFGAIKRFARRGAVPNTGDQLGFDFEAQRDTSPTEATGGVAAAAGDAIPAAALAADAAAAATPAPATPQRASRGAAARRAQSAMLLHRLHALGLHSVDAIQLMRTRRVMVSLSGRTLRIHEGYLSAPEQILRAVVTFATARTRTARLAARDLILTHQVERPAAKRRDEPAKAGDPPLLARLADEHDALNTLHFGATLGRIPVRLSGRMKTRLGHYSPAGEDGPSSEIVISRRHIRRDGWAEACHTLLHEMVHQWQDETGRALDHGPSFRKKARDVGALPRARRAVGT